MLSGLRYVLGEQGLTKFDALLIAADTRRRDLVLYCLNRHETPRVGILKAIRGVREFLSATIFGTAGSQISIAERTGVNMQVAASSQGPAD